MRYATALVMGAVFLFVSLAWASDIQHQGYTWRITSSPLVPTWHVLPVDELRRKCRSSTANACVERDLRAGVCRVYAGQAELETPQWLRWHELLHCAGYDHDEPVQHVWIRR